MNQCRKKVIPWHVHQRYMESFNQLSLNQTISAALYKKKIKSLQRNNKHLALALQRSRYIATDKENLLIDNGKILDIINFSRLKLMDMAINMKQATECLDETLLLLNSSLTDNLSKHSPSNLSYRNDFKSKLQEISRNPPIEEVSEGSETPNKDFQSCSQKGKISRVDGCASSPNKKCKLTKRGKPPKTLCKDLQKESSSSPTASSMNTGVKNSKKCGSALSIKSQNKKRSPPVNSNIESASSSKLSASTTSNRLLQTKTKQESLNKKRKAVKVILTDIAEAFLTQETENYHIPVQNGPTSVSYGTNSKSFTSNSPEDDILIKKFFSSELANRQKSSALKSCESQFTSISGAEIPNCSQNTSNSSNVSNADDIPEIDENSLSLSSVTKDVVCGQNSVIIKMVQSQESVNIVKQNNGSDNKMDDSEKDKRSYKSYNSKATNKVPLYYDEDAIVKVDGNTVASKDRIKKSINKCKARKTVSHKKKNITAENMTLKSNLVLSDNISKLGKNSFLVTAEVHPPPNGIYSLEIKDKTRVSKKGEPCVLLTDIFKSNQGLLSEMVGNSFHENECLQKTFTKPATIPLAEINTTYVVNENSYNEKDLNADSMDCENTVDEDHLLDGTPLRKKVFCKAKRKESKIICKRQPIVVLKDINCRKVRYKCSKLYSNEKNGIHFMPYLLDDKGERF